jgi:hypothetical protein
MNLYDREEEELVEAEVPVEAAMPVGAEQDDILRRYFASRDPELEYKRAELANDGRFAARLGSAFNTIGSAIGGQKADNSTYEAQAKESQEPLAKAEKMDTSVRNYMIQKYKLDASKKNSEARLQAQQSSAERQERSLKEQARHNRATEATAANAAGYKLPPEEKAVVEKLASDRGNKIAIATLIEENLRDWDTLSTDQQLARGRSMIKAMNSALGSDAVGAEESRRLGEKLEYAFGNFSNDNPARLGRDLPGFKEQALGSIKVLRRSADENAKQVEAATGRKSKIPLSGGGDRPAEVTPEDWAAASETEKKQLQRHFSKPKKQVAKQ